MTVLKCFNLRNLMDFDFIQIIYRSPVEIGTAKRNSLSSLLSILKQGHFLQHWLLKLPLFLDVELSGFSYKVYSKYKPCFFDSHDFKPSIIKRLIVENIYMSSQNPGRILLDVSLMCFFMLE